MNIGNPKYLFVRILSIAFVNFHLSTLPSLYVSFKAPAINPYFASVIMLSLSSWYSFSSLLASVSAVSITPVKLDLLQVP
jgi:hypothetical protein